VKPFLLLAIRAEDAAADNEYASFQTLAGLAEGELRRRGLKLKLHQKPFRVLALLLERAGHLVHREELRQRLWPEDTFVDFDANLNTATFDKKGILWFTGQSGVHGRVDPATGKLDAWRSPRPGTYGITSTPAGDVWFASLAGDYIGKIDTATGAVAVVDPPRKGSGPRRIWSDSKGILWVSFWNAGGVGRYDPVAKSWKVYTMPKSRSGTYAVYVDDKDRVWATDWLANSIQRFDPVTETFTTFPSDKRGASVRQMLGRPGELWGGESGNDRLVVVRD